jgi:hypothetical protein
MKGLIAVVLVLGAAGASSAQGLADAARKEKERQKANAAAGVKVRSVTNENLQEAGSGKGTFSAPEGAPPPAEEAKPKGESGHSEPGKPETSSEGGASGTPSAMDALQQKTEMWRGRYRSAKASVDSLEREVADLEARSSRIAGIATDKSSYRDPNLRTDAERTAERLPRARTQLSAARERLRQVEDGARRDGVSSGQLY